MNILVIGNGFDLAHELPTKYGDFLDSIETIKVFIENYPQYYNDIIKKEHYKKVLPLDDNGKLKGGYAENLYNYSNCNFWIEYFIERRHEIGEGWIDFEKEIMNVLNKLDYNENYIDNIYGDLLLKYTSKNYNRILPEKEIVQDSIKIFKAFFENNKLDDFKKFVDWEAKLNNVFDFIIKELEIDLDRLIRAFEIYLCYVIEEQNKKQNFVCKDIFELCNGALEQLISFNYTNTFEYILYKINLFKASKDKNLKSDCNLKSENMLYIHGKVNEDNISSEITIEQNKDNIILGVYEEIKDDKDVDLRFAYFKKYFQRILKNTDSDYKKYLQDIKSKHIYIFGHSLDVSDNDLLEDLILNALTTTIFYHNKETNKKQIINLVKMLGQKKLIEFRNKGKIIFQKQSEENIELNIK